MLAGLVRDGLATVQVENVGHWRRVKVIRFKITEAGRRALECLFLRRAIRLDSGSQRDDYNVIRKGQTVGRIYRMNSIESQTWRWTQSGPQVPIEGFNGGMADTLEDAKAAFRAAWNAGG